MVQFVGSGAPHASALWKYGLIETLRQNVWEQLTEDLFPHLKRSAQLYYGHMVERMSSETTFNAIYPEFYIFF